MTSASAAARLPPRRIGLSEQRSVAAITAFGMLLGLLNLGIAAACGLWAVAERNGVAILCAVLAFNFAMAWFALAGWRPSAEPGRRWTAAPAAAGVAVAVLACAAGLVWLAGSQAAPSAPEIKLWACPDGSEVWGGASPCVGGRVLR